MEDEKLKQYKKDKEMFDNWDIDKDIEQTKAKIQELLEKLEDLESYKIIKQRVYSGDMPVKTLKFEELFEDKNI